MKDFPFNTINLSAEDVQSLEETYKALKATYNLEFSDPQSHINKFELFNNEKEASLSASFLIDYPKANCYLNFVKIRYQFIAGRSNLDYLKCQAWAFVNLKNDFGRVLIRKETFADSVLELIHHTELKFPNDNIFNKYFNVVTNDSEKALLSMTPDFRKMLVENMDRNATIEIVNNTLVIRNSLPIIADEIIELVNFACKIGKSF